MDLSLGCREKTDLGWTYYLKNRIALTKENWISILEKQIALNEDQQLIDTFSKTVVLWNKEDTAYEMALQLYASIYCTNIDTIEGLEPLVIIETAETKDVSKKGKEIRGVNKSSPSIALKVEDEKVGQLALSI